LPVNQPIELWEKSGRAETFIPPLASFEDRRGNKMVIAPTHEETATSLAASYLDSYRDLPFIIYHIQTKFRDETRPRAGLLRVREFEMKDAYSFDKDYEGLDTSYNLMIKTYENIFKRCGLDVIQVQADSGPIGGKDSSEFISIASSGEDTIFSCDLCNYAANSEKAEFSKPDLSESKVNQIVEEIETPNTKSIEDLSKFLNIRKDQIIKTVIYRTSRGLLSVSIRGDLEINETKLRNYLNQDPVAASQEDLKSAGLEEGYLSIKDINIPSIIDDSINIKSSYVTGANKENYHLKNIIPERDLKYDEIVEVALAQEGFDCMKCKGSLEENKGIEVGHVFKLGTGYSEKLGATFSDQEGNVLPSIMGCYGIGVGRLLAAVIESKHDQKGIMFPKSIAPFQIYLIILNNEAKEVVDFSNSLYEKLKKLNFDVIFDDRSETPGVKLNDSDLLGIPLRLLVSKRTVKENSIEFKSRNSTESKLISLDEIFDEVKEFYNLIDS
jgi:prolyl-tRNA synthetase